MFIYRSLYISQRDVPNKNLIWLNNAGYKVTHIKVF